MPDGDPLGRGWIGAPAAAGAFYPADPARLASAVERVLRDARANAAALPRGLTLPASSGNLFAWLAILLLGYAVWRWLSTGG